MESKFIDGTNEQYSIREDGVVIGHYRMHRNRHTGELYKFTEEKILKKINNKYFKIKINGKPVAFGIVSGLIKYYGFKFCAKCNNKIINPHNVNVSLCKNCKEYSKTISDENHKNWVKLNLDKKAEHHKKWKTNNLENYKKSAKKATDAQKNNLTKAYIAFLLKLTVETLPEELYEHHKQLIFLKRKIAQEHNLNINSLK